jgi:hypothetical protein
MFSRRYLPFYLLRYEESKLFLFIRTKLNRWSCPAAVMRRRPFVQPFPGK